ncbi:hypothetical protein F4703DRAFT_1850891 [Phycomyces blakesleeanus]
MANYDNPKAYYNQSDYVPAPPMTGSSNSTSNSRPPINNSYSSPARMLKPNGSSGDLPPPPYSPSSPQPSAPPMPGYPSYGTTQPGLLSPALPFPVPQPETPPSTQQQMPIPHPISSPSPNPHIPRDWPTYRTPPPPPPAWPERRRRSGSCCQSWCKYLFLSILIWLLVLKYIGVYQSPSNIPATLCDDNSADYWEQLPPSFLITQNVKVVVEGRVTGGTIRVNRLPTNAQGTIKPTVRVSANHRNLLKEMSFRYTPGPETLLELIMPTLLPADGCVYVDMVIDLADDAIALDLNVTNLSIVVVDPFVINRVNLRTTNAKITFDAPWEGNSLSLQSSNAALSVSGFEASNNINIVTTNGNVLLTTAVAGSAINVRSTNGQIIGSSLTAPLVQLKSTNGRISPGIVVGQNVVVESSNGALLLEVTANKINTHTTNDKINLTVNDVEGSIVRAVTSNSQARLIMNGFKGQFKIKTSHRNSARIKNDSDYPISYTYTSSFSKEGVISSGTGTIYVATSNSDDEITFRN